MYTLTIIRKYFFPVISVVLVGISVSLLALLDNSFVKIHTERVFPYDISKIIDGDYDVIFLGDSRIQLWPEELIKLKTVNLGKGGLTSSGLKLALDDGLISNAKFIVIQIGINDIQAMNALEHNRLVIDKYKKNIKETLGILSGQYKIILTAILPPSETPLLRKRYTPSNFVEIIADLNAYLKSLESERVRYIDVPESMIQKNGILCTQYQDSDFFLHINREAYIALSKRLNKVLLEF